MPNIWALIPWIIGFVAFVTVVILVIKGIGITFIRSDQIGQVEKIWSRSGSPKEGAILSMNGEAGFQPDVLRAGLHFKPRFIYKVHPMDLVTVGAGSIAYIVARDGEPLKPEQSLCKALPIEAYEDVRKFLEMGGQRGRQRTILREGTYAINPVMFIVITEKEDYALDIGDEDTINQVRSDIQAVDGFKPVIIRGPKDSSGSVPDELDVSDKCGIVTVHDGPSMADGELIAMPVGGEPSDPNYHNNFQDPEAFLRAGGYRGLQYPVLTDGTYYINRLFATVELIPKTLVKVGETMVVNSFFGPKGTDSSGEDFTHGELVARGERGIWQESLLPGKYAFNTKAGLLKPVPTTNIILKWIAAESGNHNFDENLSEIELITKDAFEPVLPLQVVIHIDYKMAAKVIQRFGDIKVLVNQSLDPLVSSYFKNIAQTKTIIELIQQRGAIQAASTVDMKSRFAEYNLELAEVLIGTPRSKGSDDRIEQILTQLRERQVATEKLETYEKQRVAADKERELKEAQSVAEQQTALTQSKIAIEVQENQGKAEATRATQEAARVKTLAAANSEAVKLKATGDAEAVKLNAEAEAERIKMTGEAEAARVTVMAEANAKQAREVGLAEAEAIKARNDAFEGAGAELQFRQAVGLAAFDAVQHSAFRLTPDSVINMGGGEGGQGASSVDVIMALLAQEKLGISSVTPAAPRPASEPKAPVKAAAPAPIVPDAPVTASAEPVAEAEAESSTRKPRTRGGKAGE